MNYPEVKTLLYQSGEIQDIPDKWVESVPFRCEINGSEHIGFLYWNPIGTKAELKRLLGINRDNGDIVVLNDTMLKTYCGLEQLTFSLPIIKDYNKYFHDKEEYEKLFDRICTLDAAFGENGKEAYALLRSIVGDDLLNNLFSKIANSYINRLQTGKSDE